jgi:hypothetical protein
MFGRTPSTVEQQKINDTRSLTNELVTAILDESKFWDMGRHDVYNEIYLRDSEVGGAIDKISTFMGQCYGGFNVFKKEGDYQKMIDKANEIGRNIDISGMLESIGETVLINGEFIAVSEDDGRAFTILPNKYVTIHQDRYQIGAGVSDTLITDNRYYVYKEGEEDQKIFDRKDIIHIKYKDTPIFMKDNKGNETFGIYSISPLDRCKMPVWWKRQCMCIDVMWRWRNVPREHHTIKTEMFDYSLYEGSPSQKRTAAMNDAQSYAASHANQVKNQTPDNGYITTDIIDIGYVEPRSSNYMDTNNLFNQLNDEIFTSLNITSSQVNGKEGSSYANEVMMGNYLSTKIMATTEKIKQFILSIVKKRLEDIGFNDVDNLDMPLELNIATSRLDTLCWI